MLPGLARRVASLLTQNPVCFSLFQRHGRACPGHRVVGIVPLPMAGARPAMTVRASGFVQGGRPEAV